MNLKWNQCVKPLQLYRIRRWEQSLHSHPPMVCLDDLSSWVVTAPCGAPKCPDPPLPNVQLPIPTPSQTRPGAVRLGVLTWPGLVIMVCPMEAPNTGNGLQPTKQNGSTVDYNVQIQDNIMHQTVYLRPKGRGTKASGAVRHGDA